MARLIIKTRNKFIRVTIINILALFFIILGVLFLGKIHVVIKANGILENNQLYVVEPAVNGRVEAISVRKGDRVTKGQLLMVLNDTAYRLEVSRLEEKIRETELQLEQKLLEKSVNSAKLSVDLGTIKTKQDELKIALFEKSGERGELTKKLNLAKIQQAESNLEGAKSALNKKTILFEEGAISKAEYEEAELAFKKAQAQLDEIKSQEKLEELDYSNEQINLLKKNLSKTEDQLRLIQMQESLYNNSNQIIALQEQLQIFEEELKLAKSNLAKTKITAPLDGTVISDAPENLLGSHVNPGQKILIITNGDKLQFAAFAKERSVTRIKTGQKARVFLDAFPYTKYETITGRVVKIDPAAQKEGQEAVFKVMVELDKQKIKLLKGHEYFELKPGMTGKVEVIEEEKRRIISLLWENIKTTHNQIKHQLKKVNF